MTTETPPLHPAPPQQQQQQAVRSGEGAVRGGPTAAHNGFFYYAGGPTWPEALPAAAPGRWVPLTLLVFMHSTRY